MTSFILDVACVDWRINPQNTASNTRLMTDAIRSSISVNALEDFCLCNKAGENLIFKQVPIS